VKEDTKDLLNELFNRVTDFMFDPEPQHDPYLESLSKGQLEYLADHIGAVLRRKVK
jgi:hypothetical protein